MKWYTIDKKHKKVGQTKHRKDADLCNPTMCSVCEDTYLCPTCGGDGCMSCGYTGECPKCKSKGGDVECMEI